jgi:D-amino peptidase
MAGGKYMIGVDCEGVACVVGEPGVGLNKSRNVDFARRQATREADAAARALFETGAQRVIIWDNHANSLNLDYDALDRRCEIALGKGFAHRWFGMDESFDGVLFIGYHAMGGTVDAPLCHSFSSAAYQWMKINGQMVGELAIDAAVAGTMGVPPIFIASDDKAVSEAKQFFPAIETVQTKVGYGQNAALSKHPQRVLEQIDAGVRQAVQRLDEHQVFQFETPLEYELRFQRLEQAEQRQREGWKRLDAHTVSKRVDSILDLY